MSAACSTATSTTGARGASESPRKVQPLSNAKVAAFLSCKQSRHVGPCRGFGIRWAVCPASGAKVRQQATCAQRGQTKSAGAFLPPTLVNLPGCYLASRIIRCHLHITAVRHAEAEHDRTVFGIVPCRKGLGPQFSQPRAGLVGSLCTRHGSQGKPRTACKWAISVCS